MIIDEFTLIANRAVRDMPGHAVVEAVAVRPSPHGPLVKWRGGSALPRQEDGRTLSPPAARDVLSVLTRVLACRWREGTPRILPTWQEDLSRRHTTAFDAGGPLSHGGWRWLWEAGAELVAETGVKGFECMQTKEKFATIRWYYSIEQRNMRPILERVKVAVECVEHLSAFVCETCGAPGKIRYGGWAKTSCDVHADGKY